MQQRKMFHKSAAKPDRMRPSLPPMCQQQDTHQHARTHTQKKQPYLGPDTASSPSSAAAATVSSSCSAIFLRFRFV